jgi:glycosyltransferase involved in cell wall biosynthesis
LRLVIDRIVVINDLSDPKGGASQLALQSALQFRQRGHAVALLCGSGANPSLSAQGIEVVALGQGRLLESHPLASLARGIYNAEAASMVSRWVEAHDTRRTIYHVHGWSQILSPALFHGLGAVRDRVIVHAHDFFFRCPNGAMFDFGTSTPCPAKPMTLSCILKACDRRGRATKVWRVARQAVQDYFVAQDTPPLLLIHEGMASYLARSGATNGDMFVLPNPVVAFTNGRIQAERNRDVLFIGRMEATKGIDLAAAACRLAGVRLVAIGDGDLLDDMRAAYPEMSWLGRRSHTQIVEHAQQARIAVMPSRHIEPFGLAAVEALWSGLPVLSSRNSLIAPDIAAAGAGCSIDPDDTEAFASMLVGIFEDSDGTQRMSENAFAKTGKLAMSPELWIDALLETYEAYLEGGRSALTKAARSGQSGLRSCTADADAEMPPARVHGARDLDIAVYGRSES